MTKKAQYNTRQHDEVLECLKSMKGEHLTAAEVYRLLVRQEESESKDLSVGSGARKIGKATVYRQLERLVEEGFADKYIIDQNTPACFEYIDHDECGEGLCVHGKCLKCGKLFHLHCEELKDLKEHLEEHHGFTADFHHTVIYGLCEQCAESIYNERIR